MSGQARGPGAWSLRALLRSAEPIYAAVVSLRNRRFDRGKNVRRLPKPVISVGNLTAGGTGKTPVVRWLCEKLRDQGHHPAVLMRGYRAKPGERGDEQTMLEGYLNTDRTNLEQSPVIVHANPVRFDGGNEVLRNHPETDIFVLDDGFQHRKLYRDFDLVLIDAACPFGYGHVHPRGLLREPVRGLKRADAVLITRADAANAATLADIEGVIRKWNSAVPIYRARHAHTGLRQTDANGAIHVQPTSELTGRQIFAFCGIGRPESFMKQLSALSGVMVGQKIFPDHHAYTGDDLTEIQKQATAVGADVLLTTEKDWVKIAPLAMKCELPVWRVDLAIDFAGGDEMKLLEQMLTFGRQETTPNPHP